jgi:hypothetical protein
MATLDRSIQQIRKTAAQLYADNATLASGQLAIESDTKKGKIGPGAFRDLPYADFNVRAADADYANDQRDGEGGGGGTDELTADELAAINGAASPSASNVFATAEDLATKEDRFIQFFQATIDGVLHNFKPNFIIGGKMSWVADEDATAVFFFDNSGAGFWKLDIGVSGVAVASDAGDEADPTAVPSWDLTGITLVVGPQVYGPTSQEAIEAVVRSVELGKYRGKRTFSGATDTLVITDAGGLVIPTNNGSITIMVPPQGDVAFPELATVTCFVNSAAGQITFAPGSGVTLLSGGGALKTAMPLGGVALTLISAATNTWWVEGNLTV